MLFSSKSQKDQTWSSIFIEVKIEHVPWMTPFYHAKIRSITFEALFSLKRKRVRFLNEMFFTDTQVKKMSFEAPFPLKRKGPVSWMRAFLPMQNSEGSVLKLYFHWREKSLFFEWHVFWRCTVFLRRIRGASRIAFLIIWISVFFFKFYIYSRYVHKVYANKAICT